MYCYNCGKQIPDNTKFCHYCGAEQNAASRTTEYTAPKQTAQQSPGQADYQAVQQSSGQTTPAVQQRPQQKSGKKVPAILITVLVFFAAGLLGKFVLAPLMQKENDGGRPSIPSVTPIESLPVATINRPDNTADTEETETNPAYIDLFSGTRIFHMAFLFGMDVECFATKDENGSIICRDYGYQGDQVLTYVETWYFPGIAADQQELIQAYSTAAEEDVAGYADVACANISYAYNENNEYFYIKYEFTDLDQPENCQALYDIGLATGTGGLSLSKCEELALDAGFIKK